MFATIVLWLRFPRLLLNFSSYQCCPYIKDLQDSLPNITNFAHKLSVPYFTIFQSAIWQYLFAKSASGAATLSFEIGWPVLSFNGIGVEDPSALSQLTEEAVSCISNIVGLVFARGIVLFRSNKDSLVTQ